MQPEQQSDGAAAVAAGGAGAETVPHCEQNFWPALTNLRLHARHEPKSREERAAGAEGIVEVGVDIVDAGRGGVGTEGFAAAGGGGVGPFGGVGIERLGEAVGDAGGRVIDEGAVSRRPKAGETGLVTGLSGTAPRGRGRGGVVVPAGLDVDCKLGD